MEKIIIPLVLLSIPSFALSLSKGNTHCHSVLDTESTLIIPAKTGI